ncbi:hypothetical protein [Halosolutus halophilus]|uniref:hypothetical protein n=1 Tax=Halosolutus halophilus TaxID=1552990 RepID=UPI0022351BB2|nr:hypothetical protein [Halosolutus halophilus]
MVDRLARRFVDGDLIAIRDRGREALVYDQDLNKLLDERLDVYWTDRDGSVSRHETGYWRGDLEGRFEEHRNEPSFQEMLAKPIDLAPLKSYSLD